MIEYILSIISFRYTFSKNAFNNNVENINAMTV